MLVHNNRPELYSRVINVPKMSCRTIKWTLQVIAEESMSLNQTAFTTRYPLMLQSSALFASLNSPNVCASFTALERRPKPLRGKCYRKQTWIELSSVNLSGFIRLKEICGRDWPNKLRHQIIWNWSINWILAGICGRVAHALACNTFDKKHKNSK